MVIPVKRCRGIFGLLESDGLGGDEGMAHLADTFDGRDEFIAGDEVYRWSLCEADSAGCAREDDVAGVKDDDRGQLRDQGGYREVEVAGAAFLFRVAVDCAAQLQVVGIGE